MTYSKYKKIKAYTILFLGSLFALLPILWMLSISLRSNREVFANPPNIIPKNIVLEAYTSIIHDRVKIRFFINSYLVAFIVTLLTIFFSLMAAYAFSRFNFRFKKIFNLFVIATQTIPQITLLIPFFGMILFFRIYDTYLALFLTYMALTIPYSVLMLTSYLNTIPKSLDEAAIMDGGSHNLILWKILVPVSLPGIVATATYTFLLSWNEFLFALTLTKSTHMRTIPIGIQQLMGQHAFEWNQMMAISILGSFPILLLFLCTQKYFLSGMTIGSIKS